MHRQIARHAAERDTMPPDAAGEILELIGELAADQLVIIRETLLLTLNFRLQHRQRVPLVHDRDREQRRTEVRRQLATRCRYPRRIVLDYSISKWINAK